MRYKQFYKGKLPEQLLERIEAEHKEKMKALIRRSEQEGWTKKQRKRQQSNIFPNIALYQVFIDNEISKEKAKELVKDYSFYRARKYHSILKTMFITPGFFRVFRFFMRTGMKGDEIWISKIRSDNIRECSMDVLKCLWADTCKSFGCPEICEIFCLCDHIVFGNIDKLRFDRSQTLGMGGKRCDFCFKSR